MLGFVISEKVTKKAIRGCLGGGLWEITVQTLENPGSVCCFCVFCQIFLAIPMVLTLLPKLGLVSSIAL